METQNPTNHSLLTKTALQAAFDGIVFEYLRPGALGLGILYLIFGVAHAFCLPEPARHLMPIVAFASAVVLFVFRALADRRRWPVRWAHGLAAGMAGIVLLNSLIHLYLLQDPGGTINLMLLVVGVGCLLLSSRWMGTVVLATLGGWWLTSWLLGGRSIWDFTNFGLFSATVLALIIHVGRIRNFTRLEELRIKEEHHTSDLEAALKSAEREISERKRVEMDLQKARDELESRVQERTGELARANESLRNEIMERMRAEEALRKSEAKLVLAQRIGHVGSWELNLRTDALEWSVESFRIFGREPKQFVPTRATFLEAVHPSDRSSVRQAIEQALKKLEPYTIDHRIVRPDGSERLVCERAEIIFDTRGQPIQLVGTVQDITERKQLEIQLRHSQKMDAIGQLAAGVAHDFNNILTVIKGHATLLHDLTRNDAEQSELLKEISEATDRAANLIRQLLLFSRKQILQACSLDLNEVTQNLTRMLRRLLGEDITLTFQHSANLPAIEADAGMIEQILLNLAINGRDAMTRGGHLTIETQAVAFDLAHTERNPEARTGDFVRLTVSDSGCGIDPSVLPRIFEPFFTTKPVEKGTGLGLSTVYGIVRQHNGWIEVFSEVDRGTRFDIYFPAIPRIVEPVIEKPGTTEVARGTERIFVVEDETAVRQLICRLLRRHGYTVYEADSGRSALPVWQERRDEIDLLLTDLVMPGGVSGRELAEKCLKDKPGLKVIYTSGYSTDFNRLESSLRGGVRFLPKPYQFPILAKLIRECLET